MQRADCITAVLLASDCTTRVAFGVIPSGSDVCWQFAPLPTSWLSSSAADPHAESAPPVHAKVGCIFRGMTRSRDLTLVCATCADHLRSVDSAVTVTCAIKSVVQQVTIEHMMFVVSA